MFFTENMYGYENDVRERMQRIENFHNRNLGPRFEIESSDPRYNTMVSKDFSLYGKKMEKALRMATDLYREYEVELKRVNERIKTFANNPKYMKYEMEATNIKNSLLNGKLNVIKQLMDAHSKVKKAQEDDLKLQKDLFGKDNGMGGDFLSNAVSNSDTYLNKILADGTSTFLNHNQQIDDFTIQPMRVNTIEELPQPDNTPSIIDIAEKEKEKESL